MLMINAGTLRNLSHSPIGSPIFPGEDEGDQLACILEVLGMPPQRLLEQSRRAKHFFSVTHGCPRYCMEVNEENHVILRPHKTKRGKLRDIPGTKSLKAALKGCDDVAFLDFLSRCLQWIPEERITPREAFRHEWLRRKAVRPSNGNPGINSLSNQTGNADPKVMLSMPTGVNSTSVYANMVSSQRISCGANDSIATSMAADCNTLVSRVQNASPQHSQAIERHGMVVDPGIFNQTFSTNTDFINTLPYNSIAATGRIASHHISPAKMSMNMQSTNGLGAGDKSKA